MRRAQVLLSVILLLGLLPPAVYALDEASYDYTLTYTFENTGDEAITLVPEDYSLPLFINNTWQTVTVVNRSTRYRRETIDIDGNTGAVMDIDPVIPPGEDVSFSLHYRIESSQQEKPQFSFSTAKGYEAIPQSIIDQYTASTETFPMDDETIQETAFRAAGDEETVLGAVSNLLDYVTKNTTYCNFETPRYPLQTLDENLGDCDDQSILLISMCRSLGIPAYLKVGVIINPAIQDSGTSWEGHLMNEADGLGWHGWAMVYIPPWGWVPVDLTLISEETGLEYIQNSPEYEVNLIEALDVSDQAYIGNTLAARERIINSTLYVTVEDKAEQVYSNGRVSETYIMVALGAALTVAIFMMFRASNSD